MKSERMNKIREFIKNLDSYRDKLTVESGCDITLKPIIPMSVSIRSLSRDSTVP